MKKNILFVTPHMICGGVEKSLISLINEIPEEKYNIKILMVSATGAFLEYIPQKVKFGELPLNENDSRDLLVGGIKKNIISAIKKGDFFKAIKIIFKRIVLKDPIPELNRSFSKIEGIEEKMDIAIAYHMHMPFIVKYVADKIEANKKVLWIHNDFKGSKFNPKLIAREIKKYDKIFCVSNDLLNEFNSIFPELIDRTEKFNNIISRNTIKNMSSEYIAFNDDFIGIRIVSVGRLSNQKGFDIAIRVCRKLLDRGYNIRWYVIGEGKEYKNLLNDIEKSRLRDNFILMGLRDNPYPYINEADIYVQPSRHEGYCLTLAEARCLNKPIVTTNFAGAYEQIVNYETGIITNVDEDELSNAIEELISNEELSKSLVQKLESECIDTSTEVKKLLLI